MKDLQNKIARKEQNNFSSLVVSIKVGHVTEPQLKRLQSYINSHFIIARYDNYGQLVIYARTLTGFTPLETLEAYEVFLSDYHPEVSLVRAYVPLIQKGGTL